MYGFTPGGAAHGDYAGNYVHAVVFPC